MLDLTPTEHSGPFQWSAFGATYPDTACSEGVCLDLDTLSTSAGIPCPFCRPVDFFDYEFDKMTIQVMCGTCMTVVPPATLRFHDGPDLTCSVQCPTCNTTQRGRLSEVPDAAAQTAPKEPATSPEPAPRPPTMLEVLTYQLDRARDRQSEQVTARATKLLPDICDVQPRPFSADWDPHTGPRFVGALADGWISIQALSEGTLLFALAQYCTSGEHWATPPRAAHHYDSGPAQRGVTLAQELADNLTAMARAGAPYEPTAEKCQACQRADVADRQ